MRTLPSPFAAANAEYLELLEERYRTDPQSVDPSWRYVFDATRELGAGQARRSDIGITAAIKAAYRDRGHLAARLDPLDLAKIVPPDDLLPPELVGPEAIRDGIFADDAPLLQHLRAVYCGTLAIETSHIDDLALRRWIHETAERAELIASPAKRLRALELLVTAEAFEGFMAKKFPGKKRFGAEGAETLVPLLYCLLRDAAHAGVSDVVIGTMHRGRLNITANVIAKPLVQLLAEFKGTYPFAVESLLAADVPYHLGFAAELTIDGRPLRVTLAPNPSHLEAVKPVVLGRVRARQDVLGDPKRVLGILIHTDASVIAQGVVAETLQLSDVAGFTTAGTIHIVVNNQIGFTTDVAEARSSRYCTAAWKAIDSLILHANGDDPDAVLRAADLAFAFRQAHGRDAVIDLVCYRRNGHNEIDEPRFTQPLTYRVIDQHPMISTGFAARLIAEGVTTEEAVEAFATAAQARFQEGYGGAAGYRPNRSDPAGRANADPNMNAGGNLEPPTGLQAARLDELLAALSEIPIGLTLDSKVERIVRHRAPNADMRIPWALGEALAFAGLLRDGIPVRLSGEDVARGAFSHRHFVLTDIENGRRHVTLNHLGGPQARFEVINSPLSEYAVLGFEYGYSLERPDCLVIWEAQFGDFANGAQIIIDQFIASGEEKWREQSGLVMLLPHGLEGQGPEHSSARIERFLQLAARDNLLIAQPSTPANYFHLLRRQMRCKVRKPLVVMTPKSLLRHAAAQSPLAEFASGERFRPVIMSPATGRIRAVLICSGKIAYDLEQERVARNAADVAILRLEQFYPLPADALGGIFSAFPAARFAWVQEEPRNMGAWNFLDRPLADLRERAGARQSRLSCISRPESPSPAGSFHGHHEDHQKRLVAQAFDWATGHVEEV
jgi:2-oxoglutarate dehydrogenase E1 component